MRFSWLTRPVLAVLLLALVLVTVSGLLELVSAVRLAASHAAVEAGLVAGSVQRELRRRAAGSPSDSSQAFSDSARIHEALMDGLARAPSILYVAVLDPTGVAIAHTQPDLIGTVPPQLPPIPDIRTFPQSVRMLWSLSRTPQTYQKETALLRGDQPYATVRVAIAGSFLWEAVRDAASRGGVTAGIVISLAMLAGILLTRLATGRVRVLEAGIDAIRAGRFTEQLPESGRDEFARMARGLNLLGAQFDQSRVLASLGEAARGVVHQIKHQLQTVLIDLEALQKADTLPPEDVQRLVDDATHAVRKIKQATIGYLAVAKVQPLSPVLLEINEMVGDLCAEQRTSATLAGVELLLEQDPLLPETLADPSVLGQAVRNLICNSLEALSGQEGRITVRAARVGDRAQITVADDGPGIAPEILKRVFDTDFTTRRDGSGIGLALVRQSAEMHGGNVTINSTVGSGTEVTLEIPLRIPPGLESLT
jgi:signal transduction histidine kinase